MTLPRSFPFILALALVACAAPPKAPPPAPVRPAWFTQYPPTRVADVHEQRFGVNVRDPYRWLEDGKSPEVRAWLEAQATLTRRHLDALPERAKLLARLRELFYSDARSVPLARGGRLFFTTRVAAQEKAVLMWRGSDGKDHVLLDPNLWPAKDNPSLQEWFPSWDGAKLAYTVALHNGDESSLHVLDVATGKELARDTIVAQLFPAPAWTADGKGFFYRATPTLPPDTPAPARYAAVELRHHVLGDDPAKDELVHDKTGDASAWLESSVSPDGRWLFATITHGELSTEVSFRDLRKSEPRWIKITDASRGRMFVKAHHDRFYAVTNDGAPNWRLVAIEPWHPEPDHWKELVAARKDARLDGLAIIGDRLVLKYYKDVLSELEIHALDGHLLRPILLPGLGTASLPDDEPDESRGYFSFSSFSHAPEIHRFDVGENKTELWWQEWAQANLDRIVTERVFYRSKDGTRVPMFIVHDKALTKDGRAPAILEGYGGFDITYGPEYFRAIVPWLERGGVYAWADLRGGGEYGEAWHQDGMRQHKQNVFDDFVAAAEYLIAKRYTRADRLAAAGASNGGLLVGTVATQRPDLFRVILCGAPVLDMIRYPLFGGGEGWIDEYGDPKNEGDFAALIAYSPVHHVKDSVRYPSLLVLSAADDDRVDPMHARKFVAALQAASTGGPVLLRVEREAGHFGGDTRASLADEWADKLAFTLAEVGAVGASLAP
jgi:prolyl oligopeptidase